MAKLLKTSFLLFKTSLNSYSFFYLALNPIEIKFPMQLASNVLQNFINYIFWFKLILNIYMQKKKVFDKPITKVCSFIFQY